MKELTARLVALLEGLPSWAVTAIAIVLIPVPWFVDLVTGYELAFSLFYMLPVAIGSWFGTRTTGRMVALFAAASWLTADLAAGHIYSSDLIPFWNALIRLGIFLVVAASLSGLRAALRREEESARTDYLTEVANKRAFSESAIAEIERSRRYAHSFSIAYLDVDHFKRVNDTLGHDFGDRLLRGVGRTLGATVRAPDVVGRLGGGEFGLLLVETTYEQAEATMARVRRALSEMTAAEGWDVTFSVGVSTFTEPPPSLQAALEHADRIMYEVKSGGRDGILHAVWQT